MKKEVRVHSLRDSFATPHLEKGVGIRYRKETGYSTIKTADRCLRVSNKSLVNICSSPDDLWREGKIEW